MQLSEAIDRIIPLVTVVRQRQAEHYRRLADDVGLICFADLAANPVPPIPEKKTLRALLDALAAPAFVALLYVFYVGRGDFDPRDRHSDLLRLRRERRHPEHARSYLFGKKYLAQHLAAGRARLSAAGVDIDRLADGMALRVTSPPASRLMARD